MSDLAESKTFPGNVAHFRFNPGATAETFQEIFPEFQAKVSEPGIEKE
ncbi:MAG: hypothetical protein WD492_10710 [Alkalispirochaeta sp.]